MLSAMAASLAAATSLGVFGHTLARFDRDTLQPVGPQTPIIEPHARGVLSPDGKRLAMGVSTSPPPGQRGRIGLWIVDAAKLRVVHQVSTGIAAEAVAFPGVVAALLQGGELVIVDPATGQITARRRTGADSLCGPRSEAFAGGAVVPLLGPGANPRLALVDARGRIRVVRLRLRVGRGTCPTMGLAVDRAGNRAFAATGDGQVAEVSLRTRRVRYHRTDVRTSAPRWRAAWVPGAGLAVVAAGSGLHMLDPKTWRTRWRARDAKDLALSGTTLVTAGDGVRAYEPDGHRRFHALGRRAVGWFEVAAGLVYADDGRGLNVLDLGSGRVRSRLPPTNYGFWLLNEP
jgi:hypothetical protein